MATDLSFESACKIIKGEYPELAKDIDTFSSIVFTAGTAIAAVSIAAAVGPTILTPAAIILTAVGTLSNLLGVKNEIFALSESIITKITSKRDKDTLKMFDRMQQAYTLTCYTSFFEALNHDTPLAPLLKRIKITDEEKRKMVIYATTDLLCKANTQTRDIEMDGLNFSIDLPQPGDTFEMQRKLLLPLYQHLANRMGNFFELAIVKKEVQESGGQDKIEGMLKKVPDKALEYFKAQYYGLAMKYPEFAIWLNLQESEKNRAQSQEEMAEYSQKLTNLAERGQKIIDTGFKHMEDIINSIPLQIEHRQTDTVLQQLKSWYTNTMNKPIIDDPDSEYSQQALTYPNKSEIFIPQAFQVLHYTGEERLEHDQTWRGLPRREDLSVFLLNYFNHPISVRTPLIILGQPGSGKSLLTSILSARLSGPASSYTPIRIELRHVNTEASIAVQIKDQVYKDTNLERNWGELANCLVDRSPLVLFDGYDELLQATGKAFSGYLKDVEAFQRDELTRGQKPIRTIVTSRISLIDKAVIPKHTTIIRLLEFDQKRQDEWISRWNEANSTYFEQAQVEPFKLPQDNEGIKKLAEQPLLLMMLAIYDSVGNPLHYKKDLDQTLLYNELLCRFIERELKKDEKILRSWQKEELDKAIDREMQRLGVAAIGMFNRRRLYINKEDLGIDLKFFDLEKNSLELEGRQLSSMGTRDLFPAEKMFGSFFFQQLTAVYKSTGPAIVYKAQEKERDIAYEFLHNTFGEFLTADFMLRKILDETAAIRHLTVTDIEVLKDMLSQKIKQLDGFEPRWFARFIYAPLFSRPVIVNLLREWSRHRLQQEQRDIQEFLADFDTIVTNHINLLLTGSILPSLITKSDQRPFTDLPIIGYLAIYTLNLVLLRTLLAPDGYTFDETKYRPSVDGTRVWDSLAYLWRSWFSLETLNELAAILAAERDNTMIHLKIKKISGTTSSSDRLNLVHNVSQTLADNITTGLSGLLLHDSFRTDKVELDTISKTLYSERIDEPLKANLLTKWLRYLKREKTDSLYKRVFSLIKDNFAWSFNWSFNLESSVSLLAEVIQLAQETDDIKLLSKYKTLVPDPTRLEFVNEAIEKAIKLARETDFEGALDYFGTRYIQETHKMRPPLSAALLTELTKVMQLTNNSSITQYMRYIKEDYIINIQSDERCIPIPLAVELIKIARQANDQEILYYFRHNYMEMMLKQQKRMTVELAIEMIKLAYEINDQKTLIQLIEKCIHSEVIAPNGRKQIVVRHEPALIIELLKVVHEIDNQQVLASLEYYIIIATKERFGYLSSELAVAILKFAHKINSQEIMDTFSKNYLPAILQPQGSVSIELAVELIKLAQEQKTYEQASVESFYHKNITVERCHLGSLSLDTIMDIRYLAQIFGDNELVQRINARLGL